MSLRRGLTDCDVPDCEEPASVVTGDGYVCDTHAEELADE